MNPWWFVVPVAAYLWAAQQGVLIAGLINWVEDNRPGKEEE